MGFQTFMLQLPHQIQEPSMKAVTLVIGLLLLSFATQAADCEPAYTAGRTTRTASNWTKGNQALAEFKKIGAKSGVESKADELGLVRYQKTEKEVSVKNWNSGRSECNDYRTAKVIRICTIGAATTSAACADICEQSSYSDDCR